MSVELDPDAAKLIGGWAAAALGPVDEQPIEQLRNSGLINPDVTGDSPDVHQVIDEFVAGADGLQIPIRVYRPTDREQPVIVYAHGGGWTLLSIDSVDAFCRRLANGSGCTVVSVGYRLAPEHIFPAAFEDMWAVTSWAAAGGLGWTPERLAVGGDSAGGNLAAAVALHARDTGTVSIDLQLLLYPATGVDLDTPSMRELGNDPRFRLAPSTMRWFWSNYLGGDMTVTDQRAVPAAAHSFVGLPSALIVTPGFDPLRDDGRAYAASLRAAGVATDLVEPASMPHGFILMSGAVPAARVVVDNIIDRVRRQMNPARSAPSRALADEFRRRPFGIHSAELQLLLHQMRSAPIAGKPFLFVSQTNKEWVLGRYSHDVPPVPEIDWSVRFNNLESAEWHVFKNRWMLLFGEELTESETDTQPKTDASEDNSQITEESVRQQRLMRSPSVLGYADVRSVRAGEQITFFVSSDDEKAFDAQFVRLLSPEIGPVGPAFKSTSIDSELNGTHPGRYQPIHIGSCARISGPIPIERSCTLEFLVYPTLIESDARTIAELRTDDGMTLTLRLGRERLEATFECDGRVDGVAALPHLTERAWSEVSVSIDLDARAMMLRANVLPAIGILASTGATVIAPLTIVDAFATLRGASLTLASSMSPDGKHHDPATCFNGKLERPRIFGAANSDQSALAEWDFSVGIPTSTITDVSGHGLDGTLHNMPTRGVRGARWTGDHLTWTADPGGYAAIHFHDTDLADAGWQPTFTYTAPIDVESGCYALRLQPCDGSTPEFFVPFFVRPAAGSTHSTVALIVPTTTYAAYANMHLRVTAQFNEMAHGRLTVLDSTDFLLLRMPELGRSTYDVHRDGSPVVYAGMSRPVTNFRPTGRMYKLCLDLMIVDWLDAMGYRIDVVTDDDIDTDGLAALEPYRVVLTASHPEYTSRRQLDAFEAFLSNGGRMMYLGGNGFYSAAEVPKNRPDMVEVRRPGQDNLWRVNHAEAASSSSGLPTGMWRNIGRPENALTGVGFITQGFDACTFYVRSAESHGEQFSWVFAGLEPDAVIGDFGILQGGAAGYEIDRHDVAKGSPRHSVVLASSGGHSNLYDLMVSSILDTLPDPNRTQDPIRADMVFTETGNGGAVFSVGSIAWAGSLSHATYNNSVSTVTKNVLDRFIKPEPLE